jgi:hypothetical protein
MTPKQAQAIWRSLRTLGFVCAALNLAVLVGVMFVPLGRGYSVGRSIVLSLVFVPVLILSLLPYNALHTRAGDRRSAAVFVLYVIGNTYVFAVAALWSTIAFVAASGVAQDRGVSALLAGYANAVLPFTIMVFIMLQPESDLERSVRDGTIASKGHAVDDMEYALAGQRLLLVQVLYIAAACVWSLGGDTVTVVSVVAALVLCASILSSVACWASYPSSESEVRREP